MKFSLSVFGSPLLSRFRRLFTRHRLHHLSPQDGYDRWAVQYDVESQNPAIDLEERGIARLMPALDGKRVLDAGCGTGRHGIRALRQGASVVVGVDLSRPMLDRARQKGAAPLLRADLCALPLPDAAFDVVISAFTLEHVRDFSLAIAELSRVTVPGGTVLISDFHPFGGLIGWHRAFRHHDGKHLHVYHIDWTPHLYEEYVGACRLAGLMIEEMMEPRIDESVRHHYEAEGSLREYEQHCGFPLVLIMRLKKS